MYSKSAAAKKLQQAKLEPYDLVIVPGLPLENGKWNRLMKGRIYWSKYLYDKGIAKNVMYSGSAVYTPYYEGKVMALYAIAIGIDSNHVFSETRAEHSTENAFYGYQLARQLGFKRIAVASDPMQAKSLYQFGKKRLSQDFGCLPMQIDTMRLLEPSMIDPSIDYKQAEAAPGFVALPERQGFFKRLRGTMGLNIDYDAYK